VKVIAFGAADFSVKNETIVEDIPVTSWVFSENREEGFADYSIAAKPLRFYIDYIGPYPFEKLANVQSKTIFGGLENAGNIFYSENSVTGKGRAESLIAHEIAHQWFGNSVTEREWSHLWLSEGFATYLTSLYLENTYGHEKLKESMRSARDRVLRFSERVSKPVIDTSITRLMDLLNANSYQKGAWILHMLRCELGDEAFRNGLREFYRTYRDSTAVTDDFREVMEKAGGRDLAYFFDQWLCIAGEPVLKISASEMGEGRMEIIVEQMQEQVFKFPLEILVTDKIGTKKVAFHVTGRVTRYPVSADENVKLTADPDVKLLYREVVK
jgi:aminopeptidase N